MSLKKLALLLLALCLAGTGFSGSARAGEMKKYSASFYDAFDTVTQLIGYAESEAAFQEVFQETKELLLRYHRIFDAWNAYDGIDNLYSVNQNAGTAPVRSGNTPLYGKWLV